MALDFGIFSIQKETSDCHFKKNCEVRKGRTEKNGMGADLQLSAVVAGVNPAIL